MNRVNTWRRPTGLGFKDKSGEKNKNKIEEEENNQLYKTITVMVDLGTQFRLLKIEELNQPKQFPNSKQTHPWANTN